MHFVFDCMSVGVILTGWRLEMSIEMTITIPDINRISVLSCALQVKIFFSYNLLLGILQFLEIFHVTQRCVCFDQRCDRSRRNSPVDARNL